MSRSWTARECADLLTLFAASESAEDDAWVAQAITEHVASCPTCSREEADLAKLMNYYRRAESSPLPTGIEHRLLDRLCSPSAPWSAAEG